MKKKDLLEHYLKGKINAFSTVLNIIKKMNKKGAKK